jgi:hypothetical protein
VPGDRAEERSTRGGACEQPAADRREREQGNDDAGRQPDPSAEYAPDSRGCIARLNDLGSSADAGMS